MEWKLDKIITHIPKQLLTPVTSITGVFFGSNHLETGIDQFNGIGWIWEVFGAKGVIRTWALPLIKFL